MTTKDTDTHRPTPAAEPLALRLSEGLGLPPPAVNWPQDLPLRDGGAVSAGRYWTEAQMLAERERAHNAGFVEASRLHGQEIERLRAALKTANDNHERFERGWYLRGDALEAIKKHCEPQPSALAAAIVATCDSGLQA